MDISYSPLKDEEYKDASESKTRYIGCIGIKTSMRSLLPKTRSEIAKESINRLCEANQISRNPDKKPSESTLTLLDGKPNLLYAGTNVQLCVTNTHLKVVEKETQRVIIQHEMPNVSFASSGDEDTVDYVAYVAKNDTFGRACFVFECVYESAKIVLDTIARGFHRRTKFLHSNGSMPIDTNIKCQEKLTCFSNITHTSDFQDPNLDTSYRINNENQCNESLIALTRASLEKEPWFHGSYLSREESETRLKHNGDFLVRESMLDPGHFVLSVMYEDEKIHLLFDSMGQVRTKDTIFNNISHLVKYHHDEGMPIVADNRAVYLLNGVRPTPRT